MCNRTKPESHHPLPAEKAVLVMLYVPCMCSVFTHDEGKSLKSSQIRSRKQWFWVRTGKYDSMGFSPAPKTWVCARYWKPPREWTGTALLLVLDEKEESELECSPEETAARSERVFKIREWG